jgi:alkanesulfonate monooxygenase SsuD/methylene tetrahydromethanopterin reductase-like flavin-dependent oxidoreductase (luciferase family)
VRHAVYAPPFATFGDVGLVVDLATAAEQAGWDGFFLWDHLLYERDVPFIDPWVTLSAIAVSTERIRLGPLITPLPRRRPWKVAREAVTLDHLSGGRLVLGVGLGTDFWRDFGAFGEEAQDDRTRADLLDDGIEILTRLWSGEPVTYRGKRSALEGVRFLPRPLQEPRIPLWSAAIWPVRAGPVRRAARCDGVMPFRPDGPMTPEDVRTLRGEIDRHRPAGTTTYDVCVHGQRARAAELEAAGVTWLMESFYPEAPLSDVRRVIGEGPPR